MTYMKIAAALATIADGRPNNILFLALASYEVGWRPVPISIPSPCPSYACVIFRDSQAWVQTGLVAQCKIAVHRGRLLHCAAPAGKVISPTRTPTGNTGHPRPYSCATTPLVGSINSITSQVTVTLRDSNREGSLSD